MAGTKADLVDRLLAAAPAEAAPMDMADAEEIERIIQGLQGAMLAQRTPERVAHRRADLVRRRKVLETSEAIVETMDEGHTEWSSPCAANRAPTSKKPCTATVVAPNPRWPRSSAHAATCCGLMWRTSTPIEVFRSSVALK